MRIAISTDGDFVAAHFGRCPFYTVVDIEDGKIVRKERLNNPGHDPGVIPQFLHKKGAECIVCGGMGTRASGFFSELGIKVIMGVSCKIDEALASLEKGNLQGGVSLCNPGDGKGYGIDKTECDHSHEEH